MLSKISAQGEDTAKVEVLTEAVVALGSRGSGVVAVLVVGLGLGDGED